MTGDIIKIYIKKFDLFKALRQQFIEAMFSNCEIKYFSFFDI